MSDKDLFSRLKQARIVQVLVVYLGASWVVLQLADILQEALSLPEWVLPVTVLLLVIGMVIILATAWIQSLPSTTAAEAAGEVPTDWEIAPGDALATLKRGRIPHLNWGRAILGGIVAISLLFGLSGIYVIATGGRPALGPREAGAGVAAEGIAVLPFEVRGQDLEIWREGMMDLLANNLDGVGGYRTIDSRTVMARWTAQVGNDPAPDLATSLRAAGATGARYALLGSVVGLGNSVRLVANIYDLDTGEEVAQGAAEGPVDQVLDLADDLAVEGMRALLLATGGSAVDEVQAETITTTSLAAMREFLAGEASYRRGDFAAAVQSYERAVSEDSTFAIGLVRLAEAYGWLESQNSERLSEYSDKAVAQRDRLSPRYQFVIDAWDALNHGDASGVADLRAAVQKYPDDPEAWFLLAETFLHLGDATYASDEEIWNALQRATTLDPNFAPYLIHVAEFQVFQGDTAGSRETMDRYRSLAGNDRGLEHIERSIPLFWGTDEEAAEVAQELLDGEPRTPDILLGTFGDMVDVMDRVDLVYPAVELHLGRNLDWRRLYSASTQARLSRGRVYLDSLSLSDGQRGSYVGNAAMLWGMAPDEIHPEFGDPSICGEPGSHASTCSMLLATAWVQQGRFDVLERVTDLFARDAEYVRGLEEDWAPEWSETLLEMRDLLQAYGDWRRSGDPRAARAAFRPAAAEQAVLGVMGRLYMAEVETSEGRVEEAIRHYQATLRGYQRSFGLLQMARLHEQANRSDEARRMYERFLIVTRQGDQDLPQIVEAREALARLRT
jgi:tetratricopeptide (TPR) repeat protein